ncbi:alpha/beta hydrolase family protein [Capnocytophaga catalasegens]|uniref:Alpha/beta hydrolase n=1 Tax=Capnocytophaga catalasegens TaxID=1004260 RepID=A0AAV5AY45_9FLAO|nr:alpha/beta hydrolase [Capnocytophaga catalasegens]GIZ14144.1 alpha/beta hydrolase [Capnocytophaga catalasegens]GJM49938.1 alpha/beta hydrolase [Capnocytophaga catalasegens]GJM51709.1 alpha/beta hydrolase [Capnocytophaga catalasegens]
MNNTSNPKVTIEIPKLYIKIGKFLQLISNKLSSKYAIWLFFKPLKFPMPKREYPMDKNSQQYFLYIPSIKKEINIYKYGKGQKRILLVHGWSGRGTQLFSLADFLVSKGYEIISFDAPCHGKSPGNKTYMKEFVLSILEIGKHYTFDGIIGHSLGAMSSINATRLGFKTPWVIAISGGDLVTDIIDDFVKKMQMNQEVWQSIHNYLDKKLEESINEYSISVAVKNIKQPLLIIHDQDDIDVPVKCAYNIHKNKPDSELFITQGLGHRRILADKTVIEIIYNFIKKQA